MTPWQLQPHRHSSMAQASATKPTSGVSFHAPPDHLAASASASVKPVAAAAAAPAPSAFQLSHTFIKQWSQRTAEFGFSGLGAHVYRENYSRLREDGTREQWADTIRRVVEGCFTLQKAWQLRSQQQQTPHSWDEARAQQSAERMFELMFSMRMLPAGRALRNLSPAVALQQHTHPDGCSSAASLFNCIFLSTDKLGSRADPIGFFPQLMDAAMLGVGAGFDTKGAGKLLICGCDSSLPSRIHVVEDSREGSVAALRLLLHTHVFGHAPIRFDFSAIRPAGSAIKGFGGVAPGPALLQELLACVEELLSRRVGCTLSMRDIVDLANLIGRCVSQGNVRRSAEIAFGEAEDDEFITLKDMAQHPERMAFAWASNNSVFARVGMDYGRICSSIRGNGEPGLAWLDNMRKFGRMNGHDVRPDRLVAGSNPCAEMSLEESELCALVEVFPAKHGSMEEFLLTLDSAVLFAKTLTLARTHWPESNLVNARNRRMGCSISGVAQFLEKYGRDVLKGWLEAGYTRIQQRDEQLSGWLQVARSIKSTCVKPAGTTSLLAGATPGMHFAHSPFYIRRVRVPADSPLLPSLRQAGYPVEPLVCVSPGSAATLVVSFPVASGTARCASDVSMHDQLSLAALLQRHWADNQVSCTVSFEPEREGPLLEAALQRYQHELKGVSFLPTPPKGAYAQMPYEAIDEKEYHARMAEIHACT